MTPRVGTRLAGLCAALALLVAIPAAAPKNPQEIAQVPAEPDEGPLVAPGEAPDLVLLCTGAVVGYVEPCG